MQNYLVYGLGRSGISVANFLIKNEILAGLVRTVSVYFCVLIQATSAARERSKNDSAAGISCGNLYPYFCR